MEPAVRAPFVLPQHPDRPEPDGGVAADRPDVVSRRVDGQPVVPAVVDQPVGQQGDRLPAQAPALCPGSQEEVEPGVAVHRLGFLGVLDPAHDPAVHLDDQQTVLAPPCQVSKQCAGQWRNPPPPGDRRFAEDLAQGHCFRR